MHSVKKRAFSMMALLLPLLLVMFVLFSPTATGTASAHGMTAQTHLSTTLPHNVKMAATSCVADGCDGLSPVATGCDNGAVVERSSSFTADGGGVVELVFNLSCHAAWGFIKFNNAMPSGHTGDAQIFRTTDDASQLCGNSGGNGVVLAGQHSCFSGMLGDDSSESAIACGYFDNTQLVCTSQF